MTDFEIVDGVLYFDGNQVRFLFPIAEGVGVYDCVAVRLDVPAGQKFNRNVFLVERSGAVRWQIQESPHGTEDDKPFMNLLLANDGSLVVGNWNGIDYNIDLSSGIIKTRSFSK